MAQQMALLASPPSPSAREKFDKHVLGFINNEALE